MKIKQRKNNKHLNIFILGSAFLLVSGLILMGFSSCRSSQPVKYGGPPADYKTMPKP
ncbi:MAG: hypothetical protein PHR81_08115 [Bacteroidales bacterium]|jgi:hypothetical protein|nr:hypothetical protein [Bacteroidales bacterium]MDD4214758.1 hypothetical protein [Bacteroidales bacterium]